MRFVKEINKLNNQAIYLDTGDLDLPDNEKIEPYKHFNIRSYSKVSRIGDAEVWAINFRAVDEFFDFISRDKRKVIAMMIIKMHIDIEKHIDENKNLDKIDELLDSLRSDLSAVDDAIGLYDSLINYVSTSIPIGDMSNVGKRAQDTEERTFYYEHVVKLLGVMVLSKLMTPIMGTLMQKLIDFDVESKQKETHCVFIFKSYFEKNCTEIVKKLKCLIVNMIKKQFQENMNSVFHGLTVNTLNVRIFAGLITRTFVNADLFRVESQPVVFVLASVRKSIEGIVKNINETRISPRKDMAVGDEEGNKSQLEIDSVTTCKTMDIKPILVKTVDSIVKSYMVEYDIDPDVFNSCIAHYKREPLIVHDLNKVLLFNMFGPFLSGANSINHLGVSEITKLLTIAQIMCVSLGFRELGHMLTSHQGGPKPEHTVQDAELRLHAKTSHEYKSLRSRLEQCPGNPKRITKVFDNVINDMVGSIMVTDYIFNTAPAMWDMMAYADDGESRENLNGLNMQFTKNLIVSLCNFMDMNYM